MPNVGTRRASTDANRLVVFFRHGSDAFARVDIKAGGMWLDDKTAGNAMVNRDSNTSATSAQGGLYRVRVVADGATLRVWRAAGTGAYALVLETDACAYTAADNLSFHVTAGSYSVDDIRIAGAGLSTATTFTYNTANELTAMTKNGVATACAASAPAAAW